MKPVFSVVIPTYNRRDRLLSTLGALEQQVDAPAFEVVVVDDGSSDGTATAVSDRSFSVPVRLFRQENTGPAGARNVGVHQARGEWIALLGDDTEPAPEWIAAHHQRHTGAGREPVVVQGLIDWHPALRPTLFMRYIAASGLQYGFEQIDDVEHVPFMFFYSSNASLPRRIIAEHPFNEDFPLAAWEDTELGFRLQRLGVRLVYESGAVVFHNHPTTIRSFSRRQERVGYSAAFLHRIHPELGSLLRVPPNLAQRLSNPPLIPLVTEVARFFEKAPLPLRPLWRYVLRGAYVSGWARARREGIEPAIRHENPPRRDR